MYPPCRSPRVAGRGGRTKDTVGETQSSRRSLGQAPSPTTERQDSSLCTKNQYVTPGKDSCEFGSLEEPETSVALSTSLFSKGAPKPDSDQRRDLPHSFGHPRRLEPFCTRECPDLRLHQPRCTPPLRCPDWVPCLRFGVEGVDTCTRRLQNRF